jgi:hypothetical protein
MSASNKSTSTKTSSTKTASTENSSKPSSKSRKREIPQEVKEQLNFTDKLHQLQTKFHDLKKEVQNCEAELKTLEKAYNQDLQLVHKSKNKRTGERKKTGFVLKILLPEGMAKLIGEKNGTYMSLPEYTKRFYQILDQRNLRYAENKKVFRADEEILRVFNLPASVNTSTNPEDKEGFNFHTLQKIFAQVCKGAPREDADTPATPFTKVVEPEVKEQIQKEPKKITVKGNKKKEAVASA